MEVSVRGITINCTTGPGMFSRTRLDPASRLLLEVVKVPKVAKLLDVGCGWGAMSVILAKAYPDAVIVGIDVNKNAVKKGKLNARMNKVKVSFKESDVYEKIEGAFSTIITNPPQKAGKEVNRRIIEEAPHYLENGGTFWLVGRHNKGGKTLQLLMKETFGNVESVGKKGIFRVYRSTKS